MSKNILITGASGEFGKLTVMTLLSHNYTVIASMRDVEGKNKHIAEELSSLGAIIVEIDVTDDTSVTQGISQALRHVTSLDVVINNAGIGTYGLQESFTPDDWKKLFDVNVFGVQRINRAVLPHMRKQNKGLLIHISSLIGRVILPYWGVYSASKWALEALVESYKVELSSLGIESCIIEPGPYPTTFFEALTSPSDVACAKDYGTISSTAEQSFVDFGNYLNTQEAQKPQNVADAILHLINTESGKRNFRTIVDNTGMGEIIEPYNKHLKSITFDIYNTFGLNEQRNES